MRRARWFSAFVAAAVAMPAAAADLRLAPPDVDWALHVDAPAGLAGQGKPIEGGYSWIGAAGTEMVAFKVEPPRCPQALSQESLYACFDAQLKGMLSAEDYATERGNTLANGGVFVTWASTIRQDAIELRALNGAIFFVRGGKWVELFDTTTASTPDDVRRLVARAQSVTIDPAPEDAPSPLPTRRAGDVLAIVLASVAAPAPGAGRAGTTRLEVPGQGWGIRFDGPAFRKLKEKDEPARYSMFGNGERFNVSFYVEPPLCPGGDSTEQIRDCFKKSLERSPIALQDTVRASVLPRGGVMVTHMAEGEAGGRKLQAFNVNVLFAHKGKWGDLHGSYVSPQPEEMKALVALAQSLEVIDDPAAAPAPAAAASAP